MGAAAVCFFYYYYYFRWPNCTLQYNIVLAKVAFLIHLSKPNHPKYELYIFPQNKQSHKVFAIQAYFNMNILSQRVLHKSISQCYGTLVDHAGHILSVLYYKLQVLSLILSGVLLHSSACLFSRFPTSLVKKICDISSVFTQSNISSRSLHEEVVPYCYERPRIRIEHQSGYLARQISSELTYSMLQDFKCKADHWLSATQN